MNANLWEKVRKVAFEQQLDPWLLGAIVVQESAGDPHAIRFEPGWKLFKDAEKFAKKNSISLDTEKNQQACSHGLCQLMGAVAREHAFQGAWAMLYGVETNLTLGAMHLKKFLRRYGGDEVQAIVSYNAGSPRLNAEGRYVNEAYLISVQKHRDKLKISFKGV